MACSSAASATTLLSSPNPRQHYISPKSSINNLSQTLSFSNSSSVSFRSNSFRSAVALRPSATTRRNRFIVKAVSITI